MASTVRAIVPSGMATLSSDPLDVELLFGTIGGFGIYRGYGPPLLIAGQGSLYLRRDGALASTHCYVNLDGATTWNAIAAAAGAAILDFGATPASEALVAITGQSDILTTSHARAWLKGGLTADNDMKAHMAAAQFCMLTAGGITPGVGFNISARSNDALLSGKFNVHWVWNL